MEIVSPNHNLQNSTEDTEQQVVDLPVFSYNEADEGNKKYTWNDFSTSGKFDNFEETGEYRILYFARDNQAEEVTSLKTSEVFKSASANRPPSEFKPVSPVFEHRRSVALLFDWEDSEDPDGDSVTYDITILLDEDYDPIYYEQKGLTVSYAVVDKSKPERRYYLLLEGACQRWQGE